MDILWQDLRHALRALRKNGSVTLLAVATLALGIAANAAIFSVANAALLHPLPFKDEENLLRLYDARRRENGQVARVSVSARNFFAVREQAQSFASLAAQVYLDLSLSREEGPERVVGIGVSDGWLATLGVRPLLGRNFSSEEERAGDNSSVALLSYGAWGRRFGFAPDILGRTLVLNRHSYSIIGVLPRGFSYPYHPEVWLPWTFDPADGRTHTLNVQARLKPGATLPQAEAELQTIAARLEKQYPDTNTGTRIEAERLRDVLLAGQQTVVHVLFAAVGFVLLLASTNVVNLLLARFVGRQREFAIRAALGASLARHVRLLLAENIVLALAGGGAGILLTFWTRPLLMALIPRDLTYVLDEVQVDTTVLAFALLVSLAIGVILALVPALRVRRAEIDSLLKDGGRSARGWGRHQVLRSLVVAQIALALMLLSGAGLLVQNFYRLQHADLGFASENLLALHVAFTDPAFLDTQRRSRIAGQIIERVSALPGISSVAAANYFPLTNGNRSAVFVEEGRPADPGAQLVVNHRLVTPRYFETLKIPLLAGRTFGPLDSQTTEPVVIVSRAMARRYWPAEDAIGKRIRHVRGGTAGPWMTVVGVVGDVREPLLPGRIRETWYLPFAQSDDLDADWDAMGFALAVRTALDPAGAATMVKRMIWQVDGTLPIYDVVTAQQLRDDTFSRDRTTTAVFLCFAVFGLLMAALGTYGVLSYAVRARRHEMGIRIAVGALPQDILWLVLKQGGVLIAAGVAAGLAGAGLLRRFLSTLLSEIDVANPATIAGVVLLLSAVALAACYFPARRATRVDPMTALRYE